MTVIIEGNTYIIREGIVWKQTATGEKIVKNQDKIKQCLQSVKLSSAPSSSSAH